MAGRLPVRQGRFRAAEISPSENCLKTKIILLLGVLAVATVYGMSALRFAEGEAEATASMPRKHCPVIGCALP
ncbi:MAG: hypothetical protein ABS40_08690 [Agrobacterium sp. SCN 61-19]|nr:MAG: hypothetical protein ABS40_08690 [Agrobacterium sp. SCN 61-19]